MEELFRKVYYAKAAAAAGEARLCVAMICQDGSTTKIRMAQLNMYQPPRFSSPQAESCGAAMLGSTPIEVYCPLLNLIVGCTFYWRLSILK